MIDDLPVLFQCALLFCGAWWGKTDWFLHTIPEIKLTLVELSNYVGEHCVKIVAWLDPEIALSN